jgi:hypothetical protein
MRIKNIYIWLALISFILVGFGNEIKTQPQDFEFFDETGYYVRGEFWTFYQQFDDALVIFGYPITNDYIDLESGRHVQYFQKARFELSDDPENPIKLFNLGQLQYTPEGGIPLPQVNNSSNCKAFPTGYHVCMGFLSFYDTHNGPLILGAPISDAEFRDGIYVQYFENARLEFRTLLPPGQKIGLSDLGKIYFEKYGRSTYPDQYEWEPSIPLPQVVKLYTLASVDHPLLPQNSSQVINVIVLDQNQRPVEGADIDAIFKMDDWENTIDLPPSNENGISRAYIEIGNLPLMKIVEIDVIVRHENALESHAHTWFRLWW